MPRTFTRKFSYRFAHPVATVWPALADTARFNEAAGFPKHRIEERPQADGSIRLFAKGRIGRVELAWEEFPVEWVWGQWFWHWREFSKGPIRTLGAMVTFDSVAGGCVCHYEIGATPANGLGHLVLRTGFFRRAERDFLRLCDQVAEWAKGVTPEPYSVPAHVPSAVDRQRIDAMIADMDRSDYGHGLGARLVEWVLSAQEVDVVRIRPLQMARRLSAGRRETVEAMLQAVRSGLLQQRWDLLCPRCRGAKLSVDSMERLPDRAHCSACNVDYDRDFGRNVELSFTPAPALRPVYDGEYCLGGPMTTPHVLVQVRLEPGAERDWPGRLPAGPFRYRTLDAGPWAEVMLDTDGSVPTLEIDAESVDAGAPVPPGTLRFVNRDIRSRIGVIERRDWAADALTAQAVTTYQAFRDLCGGERLRPGDGAAISQVTLMFTDLRASSALYRRIGDAPAFGQVREHFIYLARQVRRHDGAVVKTMGDAVLAAFADPADAVAAALGIQRGMAGFNSRTGADLSLKIGIHAGSCLAVTLNGRLDYFGHMVNLAARLQNQADSGEIVVSDRVRSDPGAAPLLDPLSPERGAAVLHGMTEPEVFWRIRPGD
ncbi:MAG: adenylate/guanylate cyclase domain-containing protein [Pseudomonadota bacterium]|nr:adenylate/guanylate cyclase domain-containing protein [Pseudomonadota bacterium]